LPFISQIIYPPSITNCGVSRAIAERSPTGAFAGTALAAVTQNVGTSITWALVSPPPGFPFSIGLCDGQFRVLTTISWAAAQSWTTTISATNDGTAIGLGQARAYCSVTLGVIQSPLPPSIVNLALFTSELVPANSVVGTLVAVDPANYTVTNFTWASRDTPDLFSVSLSGVVGFASVVDTLALSKNTWNYVVSVCNPYICGRCV
jgi:hypothetical protein